MLTTGQIQRPLPIDEADLQAVKKNIVFKRESQDNLILPGIDREKVMRQNERTLTRISDTESEQFSSRRLSIKVKKTKK